MKLRSLISTLLFTTPLTIAVGQEYNGTPCDEPGNPALTKLAEQNRIEVTLREGRNGTYDTWSTTYLAPQTEEPALPENATELNIAEGMLYEKHLWTCMYSAQMLNDNHTTTAWIEAAEGNGIGEVVVVGELNPLLPIEIYSGFGKTEKTFADHARPKALEVMLLVSDTVDRGGAEYVFKGLEVAHRENVDLEDHRGYQTLPLSEDFFRNAKQVLANYTPEPMARWNGEDDFPVLIGLRVLDAYTSDASTDLAISELRNQPEAELKR